MKLWESLQRVKKFNGVATFHLVEYRNFCRISWYTSPKHCTIITSFLHKHDAQNEAMT
eukprot:TRINITY_DN10504_c0_g1_i1.p1 TRINITY_DN10504_c0_g1~~TRINITY_DN10504_c0_g1_i1.p1  ORF type:complete len:58 (-),score=2.17 TRINITY_DN10504_c0_g1_i1:86-259(-)